MPQSFAIIGAGIAGLTCADALVAHGHTVTLFDKGRGPGGRLSTRRSQTPLGEVKFDHGAQYITSETSEFTAQLERWADDGFVGEWLDRLVQQDSNGELSLLPPKKRYVGVPGMNGLIKGLAARHEAHFGARISDIVPCETGWTLMFEDDRPEQTFGGVICAIPAEQAAVLLRPISTAFADQAASAVSAPCWAVMASFDARPAFMQSGLRRQNVPLTWIANNANKPGRDELSSWVGHASADWSREHLEMTPEDVLPLLIADLKTAIGIDTDPVFASAHRWRYSQIAKPLGEDCLWNNELKLGVCGDWLLGDKVEHAWLSGRALSDSIRV